ncbi:uncharacterized protein LOC142585521 isoform X2 [Dermacentor variabilis]|uniref:uncharacterized protein LOC142585521 isoform X2 n=1 Tax=Dermacentor variabilis TaxID=34621 RepID=UPI003F5BD72B
MNDEIASKCDYGAATATSGARHSVAGQDSRYSIGPDPIHPTSSLGQKGSNASLVPGSGRASRGTGGKKEFSPAQPPSGLVSSAGSSLPPKGPKSNCSRLSSGLSQRNSAAHVAEEHSELQEAREVVPGKALKSTPRNAFLSRKGSQPSQRDGLPKGSPPKIGRSSAHFSPPHVDASRTAKQANTRRSASSLIGEIAKSSGCSERMSSPGLYEVNATLPAPTNLAVKNAQALPKNLQCNRSDHSTFPSGTDGAVTRKDPLASESIVLSEKKVSTAAQRSLSRKQGVTSPKENSTSVKCTPQSDLSSTGPLPQERRVAGKGFSTPSKQSPNPGHTSSCYGSPDIRSGAGRPGESPTERHTSKSPSSLSSTNSLGSLDDYHRFASGGSLSITGLIPAGEAAPRLPTQLRGRPRPHGLGRVVTSESRRKASQRPPLLPHGSPASPRQAFSSPFTSALSGPSRSSPGVYSARDAFYGRATNSSTPLTASRTTDEASLCPSSEKKKVLRRGP